MCIHKFYIFNNCGHSYFTPGPLVVCADATFEPLLPPQHYRLSRKHSISTHAPFSSTCQPRAHPYRTVRIEHGLCLDCEVRRAYLLEQAEEALGVVTIEENRWRVLYQVSRGEKRWSGDSNGVMGMGQEMEVKQKQKGKGGRVGYQSGIGGLPAEYPQSPMKSTRSSWRSSNSGASQRS